jgi:hypothetical protein
VSFDLRKNLVDHTSDNTAHVSVESAEFRAACPVGAEWITLSVPNHNSYIEDMPIEVHLRGRTIANHRKDFCIVFNLAYEWDCGALGSGREIPREAYIPLQGSGQSQMEQFVLIGVGEVAQDSQERWKGWMRSVVRLRILDSCPNWVAYRSKVVPVIDGFIEPCPTVGNGELQSSLMGRRIRRSFMDSDCVNKVVKSIPEIIEGISNQEGPSLQRGSLVHSNDEAMPSAIRVLLFDQAIRVSVRPSQEFIFEGLSVFLASS